MTRLVHDLGMTVVMAEHRLERVIQHADSVIRVAGDGTVTRGRPGDGAGVGARTSRRSWAWPAGRAGTRCRSRSAMPAASPRRSATGSPRASRIPATESRSAPAAAEPALVARGISVTYGSVVAVRSVDLALPRGGIAAVMGRNGSGKSSLLWALQGSGPRRAGTVDVAGQDPASLEPAAARRLVGLVPQEAQDLLYLETVDGECRQADVESGAAAGTCRDLLDRLVPGVPGEAHPRDLSEGQRLALVLAVQLTRDAGHRAARRADPRPRLRREATSRRRPSRSLAADGRSILLSTHDVEFVATVADRVLVMADGEIVADGSARDVLAASPAFAPQVARILAPLPYLTVDDVVDALTPIATGGAGVSGRARRRRLRSSLGDHAGARVVRRCDRLRLAAPARARRRASGTRRMRRSSSSILLPILVVVDPGRDRRRRHRFEGAGDARRAVGHRRRPAPARSRDGRHRDLVLPA